MRELRFVGRIREMLRLETKGAVFGKWLLSPSNNPFSEVIACIKNHTWFGGVNLYCPATQRLISMGGQCQFSRLIAQRISQVVSCGIFDVNNAFANQLRRGKIERCFLDIQNPTSWNIIVAPFKVT